MKDIKRSIAAIIFIVSLISGFVCIQNKNYFAYFLFFVTGVSLIYIIFAPRKKPIEREDNPNKKMSYKRDDGSIRCIDFECAKSESKNAFRGAAICIVLSLKTCENKRMTIRKIPYNIDWAEDVIDNAFEILFQRREKSYVKKGAFNVYFNQLLNPECSVLMDMFEMLLYGNYNSQDNRANKLPESFIDDIKLRLWAMIGFASCNYDCEELSNFYLELKEDLGELRKKENIFKFIDYLVYISSKYDEYLYNDKVLIKDMYVVFTNKFLLIFYNHFIEYFDDNHFSPSVIFVTYCIIYSIIRREFNKCLDTDVYKFDFLFDLKNTKDKLKLHVLNDLKKEAYEIENEMGKELLSDLISFININYDSFDQDNDLYFEYKTYNLFELIPLSDKEFIDKASVFLKSSIYWQTLLVDKSKDEDFIDDSFDYMDYISFIIKVINDEILNASNGKIIENDIDTYSAMYSEYIGNKNNQKKEQFIEKFEHLYKGRI